MNDTEKEKAKLNKIKKVQQAGAISLFSEAIKEKEIEDFSVESVNSTKADTILLVNVKGNKYMSHIGMNFKLKSLIIAEGLKKIGEEALSFFTKLESVSLPDSLTEIGRDIFRGCDSLTSMRVPKNMTRFDEKRGANGVWCFFGLHGSFGYRV